MLLRELLPDYDNWLIYLLGTDINAVSLERAQLGLYRNWSFRNETPPGLRDRWFRRDGESYKLDADIREMVTFSLLNLVTDAYPVAGIEQMDLILFRNVSIYFSQPT